MTKRKPKAEQPTVEQLMERYKIACDLKQPVNRRKISYRMRQWLRGISDQKLPIRFAESYEEILKAGRDARVARDARVVWAARDAWDARDAQAAWAARDARAAWDARVARVAWVARVARAVWVARDASWDCTWHSIAAIGALSLDNRSEYAKWMPLFEAFEAGAFAFWITDKEIVVATQPALHYDADRRLHREDGAAFEWLPDLQDYYWHGVRVSEQIVMQPDTLRPEQINEEANAEIRRVMLERYGADRYLLDSGASVIHQDTDQFGRLRALYRRTFTDDEPLVMVRVTNSTPEPTGEFREYFLRVPPTMRTCQEAISWTWDMAADEYAPQVES